MTLDYNSNNNNQRQVSIEYNKKLVYYFFHLLPLGFIKDHKI